MTDSQTITVKWRRGWSVFMVIGFGIITFLCLAMAWAAWPDRLVLFAFTFAFSLLMGAGMLRGIKMFLSPPIMFEANREKIVTYFDENNYRSQGYEVPWSRVEDLALVSRTGVGGANSRVKTVTLALRLKPGFDSPGSVSAGDYDDPRTIHLDAFSGTLRGEDLLTQMLELQRWGEDTR